MPWLTTTEPPCLLHCRCVTGIILTCRQSYCGCIPTAHLLQPSHKFLGIALFKKNVCAVQAHNQSSADPFERPAQLQAFRSEQAELTADLQHRLGHLAVVTANYDNQRCSIDTLQKNRYVKCYAALTQLMLCRENQLLSLQQQVKKYSDAVRQQHWQQSKDRIELQAERQRLRCKIAPLADVTWTCNQQHSSLADLLATLNHEL